MRHDPASRFPCKEEVVYFSCQSVLRLSPPDMPHYVSNVKEYREQKGWSQEALARELGVSRQTIVNIEKGISEPRVLLAIALAAALGVAIEQLFRKGTTP